MVGRAFALIIATLVLFGTITPMVAEASAPAASPILTVLLTAQPARGDVPLLVTFQARLSSGNGTSYDWSFGDGTYLNGSVADDNPSHDFQKPGTYNVTVDVYAGNVSGSTYTFVQALSGPLNVRASASPETGTAPLTVQFVASVSGGTETYLSFDWTFGDGGVGSGVHLNYTYTSPGNYLVLLRVADSAQETAAAPVWVNVSDTAEGVHPLWLQAFSSPLTGLALAAAIGVASVLLFRWLSRSTRDEGSPAAAAGGGGLPNADVGAIFAPPSAVAVSRALSSPTLLRPETLRTSERVLAHLLVQGRYAPDDVAEPTITQSGIGQAVGVSQNALTHVLSRLVAGQLVLETRRHVTGRGRRLKTYQLTPHGERIARELWVRLRSERPFEGSYPNDGRLRPDRSTAPREANNH